MDGQDHKTTATSTVHDGHGVHLCNRCGWPFPNPHPSAKHRRAHKRVCGTIEGYKIIHSEEHDHHLAVSDDEHASDDDEHTPSPNLVKKAADGSGLAGQKSNKSEDDVFSDAVTDFSDSGISPRLEERFESVRELDKNTEQKGVGGDLYGSGSLKVDETADRTEQSNNPRKSEETTNPGPVLNGTNHSGSVIPITDSSADAGIKVQEDSLVSVALDSEEGKISDSTLTAVGREEELCDKLVSDVVKLDLPPQTESLENLDASQGVNSVSKRSTSNETVEDLPPQTESLKNLDASQGVNIMAERSTSNETVEDLSSQSEFLRNLDASQGVNIMTERSTSNVTVEVALVDETHKGIYASVGLKEISHSTEEIRPVGTVGEDTLPQESLSSVPSVKPDGNMQSLDASELSDAALMVSSIDKEVKPKTSLAGGENADSFDASEGEKCDLNGNEIRNVESKESFSVDTVPDNSFAPEDDQTTTAFKKDVDHCEEESNDKPLETENKNGEGASVEVPVMLDSTMPSDKATDFPSSCAAGSDARNLEELSKNESSSLESRDDGFEKSIPGLVTVGSGGAGSELNHDIGDAVDKNASLEDRVSPVISDVPNNIHVMHNVVRVESVDVAETVSKLKDNNEVVASETTPEQSISKESTSLSTDSELLSENSANDNSCTRDGTSESIDTAKLDSENNVVSLREISESPTPRVQQASPTSKCLNVTSPGVEESHLSEDISTSKSVDKGVPSASDIHETSATCDDKTIINVEDVTGVDSKSLQAEGDDKLTKENDAVSAINLSGSLSSRSDSLEANCGSVVSDTLETNSQKHKTTIEETRSDKSDTFEPPSFMTLVQSGGEGQQVKAATEIETVQNNQQQKSDALQAGWFPSLTNLVNESEGRKKNEEIIAKVTNWSPVKQQHGPLKSLLNEVKSPNTKQVPSAANQKVESETKDSNAGVTKDQDTKKDVEEWNSPARYPMEIKKEKKKRGRSYWVPFVCCSSVHRDL